MELNPNDLQFRLDDSLNRLLCIDAENNGGDTLTRKILDTLLSAILPSLVSFVSNLLRIIYFENLNLKSYGYKIDVTDASFEENNSQNLLVELARQIEEELLRADDAYDTEIYDPQALKDLKNQTFSRQEADNLTDAVNYIVNQALVQAQTLVGRILDSKQTCVPEPVPEPSDDVSLAYKIAYQAAYGFVPLYRLYALELQAQRRSQLPDADEL